MTVLKCQDRTVTGTLYFWPLVGSSQFSAFLCVNTDPSQAAVVYLQVETTQSGTINRWPRSFSDVCTPLVSD